jgi:hypothetical protein
MKVTGRTPPGLQTSVKRQNIKRQTFAGVPVCGLLSEAQR